MAPSDARYYGFNILQAAFQRNNGGTAEDVALLFANKIELDIDEEDIVFAGDGQEKHVYLTKAITVNYTPDTIDLAAISTLFGKSKVSSSLPAGLAELTWMGDTTEAGGVSAGF